MNKIDITVDSKDEVDLGSVKRQYDTFASHLESTMQSAGDKAGKGLSDGVSKSAADAEKALKSVGTVASTLKPVDIEVTANTGKAESDIKAVEDSGHPVDIPVTADIGKAEANIKGLAGHKIDIPVEADTGKAETKLKKLGDAGPLAGEKFADGFKESTSEIGTALGDKVSGGLAGSLKSGGIVGAAGALGVAIVDGVADKITEGSKIQRALEMQFNLSPEVAKQYTDLFNTSIFQDAADSLNNLAGRVRDPNIKYLEDMNVGADELAATMARLSQTFGDFKTMGVADQRALTVEMAKVATTAGIDVTEALKGADSAARTFGLSAWDAVNLVGRGFRELGPRGADWAETLTEYPMYFKRIGLSAEDMFNVIKVGTEHGSRDTDKMADAFKEFSLRTVDGSATTHDAYLSLGLDIDKTTAAFGRGGQAAKEATDTVIDKLNAIQDPVERNRIGVELFGTQWEDTARDILKFNDILPGTSHALDTLTTSQKFASEDAKDLQGAISSLRQPFKDAATEASTLKSALDTLHGVTPSLQDATQAWNDFARETSKKQDWDSTKAGVQGLTKNLVDLRGQVDTTSEAGSKLADWAKKGENAFINTAAAMREAHVPADQMSAKLEHMRQQFIDNAVAQGLPAEAAKRLADAYHLIPTEVSTAIYSPNFLARMSELGLLGQKIVNLPDGTFEVYGNTNPAQGSIEKLIQTNDGRVIHLYVQASGTVLNTTGGSFSRLKATGGPVAHAAEGGARTGPVLVNEQGQEGARLPNGDLITLPMGSSVVPAANMAGMQQAPLRIELIFSSDGTDEGDYIVKKVQRYVRVVAGGNVQVALGRVA